jgi:hypothetical protein
MWLALGSLIPEAAAIVSNGWGAGWGGTFDGHEGINRREFPFNTTSRKLSLKPCCFPLCDPSRVMTSLLCNLRNPGGQCPELRLCMTRVES